MVGEGGNLQAGQEQVEARTTTTPMHKGEKRWGLAVVVVMKGTRGRSSKEAG